MRRSVVKLADGREIVRLLPETPAEIVAVREAEKNGARLTDHSFGDVLPKLKSGESADTQEGS